MAFSSDALTSDTGEFILSNLASVEDDLSDVSEYMQNKSAASVTEYTLLDVSNGPKTVLMIEGYGHDIRDTTASYSHRLGPVTIDGASNNPYPAEAGLAQDSAGDTFATAFTGPPFRYDNSLKVEWEHTGTGHYVYVCARILGSGPHSIAVVKDGEPVYLEAAKLSEETIERMNVPAGYKIVRNPEIAHESPQTKGMWDDDREEVVDHPYRKPFHDTLEKLNERARITTVKEVLDEIEKNPTPFDGVREELPGEDPVEEAVQFWYEREKEKMVSLEDIRSK